jgi:hypothetical protein
MQPVTTLPAPTTPNETFECAACEQGIPDDFVRRAGTTQEQTVTACCPHCRIAYRGVRRQIGASLWQWLANPTPLNRAASERVHAQFNAAAMSQVA